ncbi:MAG: DNA replication/repair protein RecF [Sphaerochaetaceae bacterium]|jgi:DNA replication and repair protein RecF
MRFTSIGFQHFRNLTDTLISTDAKHVVLVGENGQGKSNFLEAIYTLCYGSSFRTPQTKHLVRHGEREFALSAIMRTDEELLQQMTFRFKDGAREIRIDGKEITDRKELLYHVPCIVFTHDDIEFIRGEPEQRRRFFDQTMSMYDPLYFDDLRRYRALLRQRNAAIKEEYYSLLPLYNEQLAEVGLQLQQKRASECATFNTLFTPLYKEVSQSDVNIHVNYKASWGSCNSIDEVVTKLEQQVESDMRMQTTTSGPHRDQFVVTQDNLQFSLVGSTGQMRLASLLFRIAQMMNYKNHTSKKPVLLIDDVLLELDIVKRGLFLSHVSGYSQAFFTFLPDESYFSSDETHDTLTYQVKQGNIVEFK